VKRQYNTTTHRWYLCECPRPSCREEFYLATREYERASLGEVRLVVPEHKPVGVKVLARWQGVVMIARKDR
jgi:hypothetical protein